MHLSRIRIENFRNFSNLDVGLGGNLVVVGENRVGKSNLLHALRLIFDPSLPDSARQLGLRDIFVRSRTLIDESEKLDDLVLKTAPGGPHEDMTLGQFCGHGEGNNRINLTTLHSSKGREFRVVVMFGLDEGGIPRRNSSERGLREARRLFYVGFTRAEEEIHVVCTSVNTSRFVRELEQRLAE